MALVVADLIASFTTIASNPPDTHAGAAGEWGDAVAGYAANVTPPSTTVVAAGEALAASLEPAFASNDPSAIASMETAFLAFGSSVGGGMAGVVVPPPGPVGLADIWADNESSHAAAASELGNAIDVWMKTGTTNGVNWA